MNKKLYVEFTRPKKFSFVSACIMMFERTKYSHVRFQWQEGDQTMVYEASGSSVKFLGEIAQGQSPVVIASCFSFDLSDAQWQEFKRLRMKFAGIHYGVMQVAGIILSRIFRFKSNPFSNGQYSQICSEVVARILHDIFDVTTEFDFDMAGPRKIHKLLLKYEKETPVLQQEVLTNSREHQH